MANRDLTAHVKRIGSQDKIATGILTAIVGVVMVLVVAIIAYILIRGGMRALTPGFLTNTPTDDVLPGIVYQLWDSFYLLLVTLVISVPISLGAAIFLVEYAPDNWITSAASTAIETLHPRAYHPAGARGRAAQPARRSARHGPHALGDHA